MIASNSISARSAAASTSRESRPPVTGTRLGRPGQAARAATARVRSSAARFALKPAPIPATMSLSGSTSIRRPNASGKLWSAPRSRRLTAAQRGSPDSDQPPPSIPASASRRSSLDPEMDRSTSALLEIQITPGASYANTG